MLYSETPQPSTPGDAAEEMTKGEIRWRIRHSFHIDDDDLDSLGEAWSYEIRRTLARTGESLYWLKVSRAQPTGIMDPSLDDKWTKSDVYEPVEPSGSLSEAHQALAEF